MKHINKKFLIVAATVLIFFIIGGIYAVVVYNSASAKLERAYSLAPEIKNTYKLDKASLVLPAQDENSVEMKLGERDANEFIPNLEISRWEGEVSMKLKPDVSAVAQKDKTLNFNGEKIEYSTPDVEYHFYNKPDISKEGGYEFEAVYDKKPQSNIVEIPIETKNLDFFYQPDGSYSAYAHNSPFHDGKIHRVESAFTILRPKIIDNVGAWVWGELNIDTVQGKMTIAIPQDFLDKAVYPIIVDPTIALVNNTTVTGGSGGTTPAIVTTNATLLVAITLNYQATAATPTDNKSNSWTTLTNRVNGDANVKISYVVNPTVGTGHTFSVTGTYATIFVLAFSGTLITASVYDQESTGNAAIGVATLTLGSITPAENNEVVVSGTASANDLDTTWINDVLSVTDTQPSGSTMDGGAGYLVQTTATPIAPVWTRGATDKVAVGTMATFKAAAGTSCGDGTCNGDETCVSCPSDCGVCKVIFKPGVILKRNVIFGHPAATAWACGDSVNFTYRGGSVTYGTVASASNTCWLDRNLGASQIANASTDIAAYGDYFQWGREDDGHQASTSATVEGDMTLTAQPGHANFIIEQDSPYDWATSTWITRWTVADDDPCPSGWHVPTYTEWDTERLSWGSNDTEGAFASPLKLTAAGLRSKEDWYYDQDISGRYWSSTVTGDTAYFLYDTNDWAALYTDSNHSRTFGMSIRCLKD